VEQSNDIKLIIQVNRKTGGWIVAIMTGLLAIQTAYLAKISPTPASVTALQRQADSLHAETTTMFDLTRNEVNQNKVWLTDLYNEQMRQAESLRILRLAVYGLPEQINYRQPPTTSPATNNQQPTTNNPPPATNPPPTTNNQQPTTNKPYRKIPR